MAAMVNNEAALRPIEAQGLVVLDKGIPLVVTNEDQDKRLPWQQTQQATPIQHHAGAPLQPGDRLFASYELVHLGDSGSWFYKRDKASESMVNRIIQK
eukprot:15485324-Alexandrium_andersonii.AAC.1